MPADISATPSDATLGQCSACNGYGYVEAHATPSSPETPAELTEALIAHERLCMVDLRRAFASDDPAREIAPITKRIFDSRSALLALYNRQREEIEEAQRLLREADKLTTTLLRDTGIAEDEIASLQSQIASPERLRHAMWAYDAIVAAYPAAAVTSTPRAALSALLTEFASLSSQLERLKAEQRFTEDDWWQVDQAVLDAEVLPRPEIQIERLRKIAAALRLRSLSDQKEEARQTAQMDEDDKDYQRAVDAELP